MTRLAARRIHAAAMVGTAVAAIVAAWTWNEATKPVRWAGHLTEGWKRADQGQGSALNLEDAEPQNLTGGWL